MKIGILTFQSARNFGALLQCYALQEILKKAGHNVYIINYKQKNISNYNRFNYKLIIRYLLKLKPLAAYYTFIGQKRKIKLTKRHKAFANKYLSLTRPCKKFNIPYFDKYIIGSDQVWSLICTDGELDETYFGCFKRPLDSKLIGYAISSNQISLEKLGKERIMEYLNNFSSLSFREQNISESIKLFSKRKYPVVLDPTLLAMPDIYNNLLNEKITEKQYIVTYNLRKHKKEIDIEANRLASKLGYEVIDISFYNNDVVDFVSLIKNSKLVVTSSFHGVAFSIIFHKPLYSIRLNDGHDDRSENILKSLKMENCIHNINFSDNPVPLIDWERVECFLKKMREESLNFLIKSISE